MGAAHRFEVGEFVCHVLSDGTGIYPGKPAELVLAAAPRAEAEAALAAGGYSLDEIPSPCNALLLETATQTILFDSGNGKGILEGMGQLPESLRAAGFRPDDIDLVIISHGHFDHIGGLVDDTGALAFRNARYVMWRRDWEHWTAGNSLAGGSSEMAALTESTLQAIADKLQMIDAETEIVPGVCALATPGHSPGHISLLIESGAERLIYVADALAHPLHFEHPDWSSAFDFDPQQAAATRRRLLARAVETDALMLIYHCAFPGLGHAVPQGETWRWQAAE